MSVHLSLRLRQWNRGRICSQPPVLGGLQGLAQHLHSASPSLSNRPYPMRFWPALSIKEDKPGNAKAGLLLRLWFAFKSAWLTTVCDGQRSLNGPQHHHANSRWWIWISVDSIQPCLDVFGCALKFWSLKICTGWWFEPLWKILVNWDDIPNIWENKKCSKPPTSVWL